MKKEQDILLTVIKNLIESGVESERILQDRNKIILDKCRKKYNFLKEFWEKHKKEFLDQGFQERADDYYPYIHPLANAYNIVSIERAEVERDDFGNETSRYTIEGISTTGEVSHKQLAKFSGLSVYSVKRFIKKLEDENVLGKFMLNSGESYYYYFNGELTCGF